MKFVNKNIFAFMFAILAAGVFTPSANAGFSGTVTAQCEAYWVTRNAMTRAPTYDHVVSIYAKIGMDSVQDGDGVFLQSPYAPVPYKTRAQVSGGSMVLYFGSEYRIFLTSSYQSCTYIVPRAYRN